MKEIVKGGIYSISLIFVTIVLLVIIGDLVKLVNYQGEILIFAPYVTFMITILCLIPLYKGIRLHSKGGRLSDNSN